MLRLRNLILCSLLAALSAPAAFADEARQVFDSLYAQKIRQVTATADRADDIALAKEMLASARESGSTPTLQILLAEATADLAGRHPDGYATAIEALQLVADEHEGQREAARAKMIDLLTRQSRTGTADARAAAGDSLIDLLINMGDEKAEKKQYAEAAADYRRANTLAVQRKSDQVESIKAKLEFAMSRDRAVKQIARLQEKLLQNANDHATAEEIVKLYVRDLQDAASAGPFVTRVKNPELAERTRLASKDIGELDADACLSLGEWYKELAVGLPATDMAAMLERSSLCLTRFLSLDDATGLAKTKAEILLKDVVASLEKLQAVKGSTPPTITAKQSSELTILEAQYGADGAWIDVTAKVKKMAQKDRLVVQAGTWLVGYDPKFGANKSLKVRYKVGPDEQNVTTGDGGILVLFTATASSNATPFHVVDARYGAADGWVDVTRMVRSKARSGTLTVVADMADLGVDKDPSFGSHKNLVIFYYAKGEPLFKIVRTSERAVLP